MKLTEYIRAEVTKRLDASPVVVWYDESKAMLEAAEGFGPTDTTVVRWNGSMLETRRLAEETYRQLYSFDEGGTRGNRLLIYLPWKHSTAPDERLSDPMEVFSLIGTVFGDAPSETLQSMARMAMPEFGPEIDHLFDQGSPSIAQLESLSKGSTRGALMLALGTATVSDVVARLLCDPDAPGRVDAAVGARAELIDALREELAFQTTSVQETKSLLRPLGRYVLLSEFLLDLPAEVRTPANLSAIAHAPANVRERVFAACARMRRDQEWRGAYIDLAIGIEKELDLATEVSRLTRLGIRDTFPCEERHYLQAGIAAAVAGRQDDVRAIIAGRVGSVWRNYDERPVLWKLLERCVAFLDVAADVEANLLPAGASVKAWVERYTADLGGWRLDHHQRLFEQAEANAAQFDEVEGLVAYCRKRYRAVAEAMQGRFLNAVVRDGWAPTGFIPHVRTFTTAVQPELDAGRRVAYFFVDAMRYEMGQGLAEELKALGEVSVRPVTNVLPAVTPCGMAALLPGAENTYRLEISGGEVIPSVGGKLLPTSKTRMEYCQSLLGDLFGEADLSAVMTSNSKRLEAMTRGKSLFVVRSQDIDGIGENMSAYTARTMMSGVLGDLRTATRRLAEQGFQTFVYIGDHGHVLLPEWEAGHVVPKPAGQWLKEKRRSLVGTAQGTSAGTVRLPTAHVGMTVDAPDLVVATGFAGFSSGQTYFHEGLSLQECVVPLVVLEAKAGVGSVAGARVTLTYRTSKFTSKVISIRAAADGNLFGPVEVRIEAFDAAGPSPKVGDAADCDARNPETGLITLQSGIEVQVPVRIHDEFKGEAVELRAIDPVTGRTMGSLTLQNGSEEW